MRVLIRNRDAGSRALLNGLFARLVDFEVVAAEPGQPIRDLTGVDAVFAIGRIAGDDIRRGNFGLIQTMGTGYDHVDVATASALGVWVANLPAGETGNADGVAELAILLALALFRRLDEARANVAAGKLAQPVGRSLLGKTALIVGLGAVGLAVAQRLQPFGMNLIATRKAPQRGGPHGLRVCAADQLTILFSEADLVIVCARPHVTGKPIVEAEVLKNAKPGSVLINVSRGSVLDYAALEQALRTGKLAGAGLDVFPAEPVDPRSTLLRLPQVIATPHLAGVTDVNVERSLHLAAENFRRFSRGQIPRFLLNSQQVPRPRSGHFPSFNS